MKIVTIALLTTALLIRGADAAEQNQNPISQEEVKKIVKANFEKSMEMTGMYPSDHHYNDQLDADANKLAIDDAFTTFWLNYKGEPQSRPRNLTPVQEQVLQNYMTFVMFESKDELQKLLSESSFMGWADINFLPDQQKDLLVQELLSKPALLDDKFKGMVFLNLVGPSSSFYKDKTDWLELQIAQGDTVDLGERIEKLKAINSTSPRYEEARIELAEAYRNLPDEAFDSTDADYNTPEKRHIARIRSAIDALLPLHAPPKIQLMMKRYVEDTFRPLGHQGINIDPKMQKYLDNLPDITPENFDMLAHFLTNLIIN